jgi:hypothetical protein
MERSVKPLLKILIILLRVETALKLTLVFFYHSDVLATPAVAVVSDAGLQNNKSIRYKIINF